MGLLTDPSSSHDGIVKRICQHYVKISWFFYLIGISGLFIMVHPWYSAKTYFSENALLPGLVKGEFDLHHEARSILEDLKGEAEKYPNSIPFPFLEAKLIQMGLEVYTHNFTLRYPFGEQNSFTGQNIYAILRAPRASSTESLVMSVPYRPPYSPDQGTDGSIALLLATAKFFRRRNYWAKDIIFLITQHEQLGVQAWLEAYHQTSFGIIEHGDLEARAGAIQAAVNLEIEGERVTHLNVKVEGLNGQLPNLDLFNLVNRLCIREGVKQMFQGLEDHPRPDSWKGYIRSLNTFTSMMLKQATGIPSGSHGLFHRFGIEAVTIEGVVSRRHRGGTGGNRKSTLGGEVDFYTLGRIIEGVYRSLNNLLERFHQSFFFYLLPSSNRYVSIGMYMPFMGFLGGAFVLNALGLWLESLNRTYDDVDDEDDEKDLPVIVVPRDFGPFFPIFIISHVLGLVLVNLPRPASLAGLTLLDLATEDSVLIGVVSFALVTISVPLFFRKTALLKGDWKLLKCFTGIELAILAFSMSLCNFSLAFIMSAIYVPVALLMRPSINKGFRIILALLTHPVTLLFLFCFIDTYRTGPIWGGDYLKLALRSFEASKRALMYSISDGYIYGNVAFDIGAMVLFPCWTQLWFLIFVTKTTEVKLKVN